MAQRIEILLTDDIDGQPAAETITFSFDGAKYVIDLSDQHAHEFRDMIQPWTTAARRTNPTRRTARRPATPGSQTEIRRWAQQHGYDVKNRGRINQTIVDAYTAAHHQ